MKNNILLKFCIASLLFTSVVKSSELIIAITEYPPHVNVVEAKVKGSILQYLNNMFSGRFDGIKFVNMSSKRAIRELEKGTVDLFFPYVQRVDGIKSFAEPILNVVPGLCFKKNKFIPILSAPGALDGYNIGVPPSLPLVPIFSRSAVKIKIVEGNNVLKRGVQLLLSDRIDAFYHPSPINVYHYTNPLAKKIACSLFYGYAEKVYIGMSPELLKEKYKIITKLYEKQMSEKPYEIFLLDL